IVFSVCPSVPPSLLSSFRPSVPNPNLAETPLTQGVHNRNGLWNLLWHSITKEIRMPVEAMVEFYLGLPLRVGTSRGGPPLYFVAFSFSSWTTLCVSFNDILYGDPADGRMVCYAMTRCQAQLAQLATIHRWPPGWFHNALDLKQQACL